MQVIVNYMLDAFSPEKVLYCIMLLIDSDHIFKF